MLKIMSFDAGVDIHITCTTKLIHLCPWYISEKKEKHQQTLFKVYYDTTVHCYNIRMQIIDQICPKCWLKYCTSTDDKRLSRTITIEGQDGYSNTCPL